MEKNLKDISLLLRGKRFTRLELERAARDLTTVEERLRRREYKKSSFSSNRYNVPERARDFFVELEFHSSLGRTWAAILKAVGVSRFRVVADICPGFAPKVELALYYLDYRGQVVVVDQNRAALNQLKKFLDLFNYDFKFKAQQEDFLHSCPKVTYPLVTANHIVDDLVINHYCRKENIAAADVYTKEECFKETWQAILSERKTFHQESLMLIADAFDARVRKGGWLLLSQYKSYIERILDLDQMCRFTRKHWRAVAAELVARGYRDRSKLAERALKGKSGHFGGRDCLVLKKG